MPEMPAKGERPDGVPFVSRLNVFPVIQKGPPLHLCIPFIAACLLSSNLWAMQDPTLKWHTFETEHFRINYHDGLEFVADRVANAAEEARRRIIVYLGYVPKGKVEVVVNDIFDDANAMATPVGYNQIHIRATSPPDLTTLEDYDDWMLGLMVHEYTHILHLDNWGGVYLVLNHVLGRQFFPNAAQPLWVMEGYAVHSESTRTGGGRLNSATWNMYMRMAAIENNFLPLDTMSSGTITWPHGTAFYLYGSFFINWTAERYGEDFLWKYSKDYGDDLLPFGINRDIKKITGKTWIELYGEWRSEMKEKYFRQQDEVESVGLREGIQVTFTGENDRSPRFSPNGKQIAYYTDDGHDRSGIYFLDTAGPEKALDELREKGETVTECSKGKWKEKKLLEVTGQASLAWTPDGGGMFFSRDETWKNWYEFHDLYYIDVDGGKAENLERLTEGRRSRQPDISPDADRLVYTINRAGSSFVFLADDPVAPEQGKIIDELPPLGQAYSPRFSPDGTMVAYSAWLPGAKRDIRVVDLETSKARTLTSDRYIDTGPAWDPSGRYLYFCSDRTGIFNIYAFDFEDDSLWQVTNVLGGTYQPDVSPDGTKIVYIGYRSKGYDLFLMEINRDEWMKVDENLPNLKKPRPEADLFWTTKTKTSKKKRYNPLLTLYPRTWMFRVDEDGFGQSLTIFAGSMDIAGHHSISGNIKFGLTGKNRFTYGIEYGFYRLPCDIKLNHSRYLTPQGGLRIDNKSVPWDELGYRTSLTVTYPLKRKDYTHDFHIKYRFTYMTAKEEIDTPVDPNAALPVLPDKGWLSGFELGWRFSNIHGAAYAISAEQGGSLWANLSFDIPELGSDYSALSITYGTSGYFEIPFLKHNVIAVRFAGGYGSSTFSRRGIFVLGGFPEQDIIMDIVNQLRMWSVALRGYPPAAMWGEQYYLLNFEYRIPLLNIFRGITTVPWQIERLYMSVFTDSGLTLWGNEDFDADKIKTGLGAELFFSMKLAYYESITFRLGYAYGFMDKGGHNVYFVLSSPF